MSETPKAAEAYRRYLALGPERTLDKLAQQMHRECPDRKPQTILRILKRWSAEHDWQGRLARIAEQQRADAEFAERERVRQLLNSGLALTHERIARLSTIADLLYGDLTSDGLWLTDYKGKHADVRIERPNGVWVSQYRAILDDIAREVGQRRPPEKDGAADGNADERRVALMSDDERARRVAELLERGRARGAGPPPQPADDPA